MIRNLRRRGLGYYQKIFFIPLVVLIISFVVLTIVWRDLGERQERRLRVHFDSQTSRITDRINWRMSAFAPILHGAAGLFMASEDVSREEWARYAAVLELDKHYSGIQALGYIELIARDRLAAHISAVRKQGFPDYTVHPAGDRADYSSLIYVEPFTGSNLRQFGYDMRSEPVRRAALEAATDSGGVAFSGRVTLVMEAAKDDQPGLIAVHAVYANHTPTDTVAERRAAVIGWVVAPYRIQEFLGGMLRDDLALIRLEIFDAPSADPASLLYDSDAKIHPGEPRGFTETRALDLEGRTWTLRYSALPEFGDATQSQPPWVEFSGILVISLLLFAITWALVNTRRRAERMARTLTRSLHQSQTQLLESLHEYRDLVTRIPVGVFTLRTFADKPQQFAYVSPRFCAQMRVSDPAVRANALLAYANIHPDDRAGLASACEAALAAFERFVWEGRVVAPSGTTWTHIESVPTRVADGEVTWSGMVYDITDRKQAEQALAESEARFRHFFDRNSSVMLLIDPEIGAVIAANAAATAYYGYPGEQLIGMPMREISSMSREDFAEEEQSALREHRDHFFFNHRLASGELRNVEIYSTPIESGGRDLLFSIVHDITERKHAEARLRLAATVFSHAREGIFIAAADGAIIDVNDAFSEITGYSRAEVLGRNPRLLSSGLHDSDFFAAMWQGLAEKDHWDGEVWNRRKNGDAYAQMLTISTVRDSKGAITQYVALFSDITPLKDYERELKRIAHYDALTGLPNRILFADRLQQAMVQTLRREQQLVVVYLDIDGFKAVNDRYGHEVGDQLLVALADRMKQTLREGDTLARLGGDEFVAILLDLSDPSTSIPMLGRLLAAAAQPTAIGGLTVRVSASLGATFYPQRNEIDADLLLRQADQAMYQAKTGGKNRYVIFDSEGPSAAAPRIDERQLTIPLVERGTPPGVPR